MVDRTMTIAPTQAVANEARGLLEKIESSPELSITVQVSGAGAERVGPELLNALKTALAIIGNGQKVEITGAPQDLTTTVAAKRVGVSRPTLMKLIREGAIPAHKAGTVPAASSMEINAKSTQSISVEDTAYNNFYAAVKEGQIPETLRL